MFNLTPKAWNLGAAVQLVLAAAVLLAVAFSPGEAGRTLLVPINGKPVEGTVLRQLMLRPVVHGPLPGSVIVEGSGRSLAGSLIGKGIVMLTAPVAVCGRAAPPGITRDG